MPSAFPGMDPYLEGSARESFHAAFVDELGRQLAPKVRPKYMVRVERRLIAGAEGNSDDLSIAPQRSLGIFDVTERVLVAAIELLSPSNKRFGGGREEYIERRQNFLASTVHLIEVDLLRRGTRIPMREVLADAPYFAFLSRAENRPMTGVWPISLRESLPKIPVPLLPGDADVALDLQAAINQTYDAFGFDLELDYRTPPETLLDPDDRAWAAQCTAAWRAVE